jgi:hypothetical protein
MCIPGLDPITLAALAASAGGAAINRSAQNQAADEQNRQNKIVMDQERAAAQAESDRQRQFELAQASAATKALFDVDPTATAQEVAAAAPVSETANIADDYAVPVLQGQITDGESAQGIGEIITGATARLRKVLGSAASLTEMAKRSAGNNDAILGMQRGIQNIGGARQGSLNASRLETNIPAATVTANQSPLGDILMAGGLIGAGLRGQKIGAAGGKKPFGKNLLN